MNYFKLEYKFHIEKRDIVSFDSNPPISIYFLANASCIDKQQLETLMQSVLEAYDQGVLAFKETNDNWNLWSSFFFSATVVTTIGKTLQQCEQYN